MVELSDQGNNTYKRAFAGDTLNAAVYLSRCLQGTGHKVHYVTAVGDDTLSDMMISEWQSEGIVCDTIAHIKDKAPGLYSISLDEHGERTFSYWRNDSAARRMLDNGLNEEQLERLTANFDILFLSGITLAILDTESRTHLMNLLRKARDNGAEIVFDSNYRPCLWASEDAARDAMGETLALATMALVTFDDEQALWNDESPEATTNRLRELGIAKAVVKLGAEGCLTIDYSAQDEATPVTTIPVEKVVDTTSAGDSFNGGFLSAYMEGKDLETCCQRGNALAGIVIQHRGAIIPKEITDTFAQTN
ncbi:sugar kinase [Parendozoicomonas haliclonae]|uniref:2-dehydro-3-deoxygluconokinase n=2 Tax=Parendozoicomonas haliclonae TaxID=1960125 RepID=A0A1X7AIV3_9GAMM|nr:2-dehydro-3-deoxygluconokinase [Parendozoicomonas haliclonae]